MRSIQRNFEEEELRDPFSSTFINFGRAIKNRGWSEPTVRKWFYRLVDKEDYAPKEARDLIKGLVEHARRKENPAEEAGKRG